MKRNPLLALTLLTAACGGTETTPAPAGSQAITLSFDAQVAGAPFVCGQEYDNLGTQSSTLSANDLRLYISQVHLLDASGAETPLALTQDEKWQYQNLALLDFEDGCGGSGNAELRNTIVGEVPKGDYVGVKFTLGVPFELNHADASVAPSPLNLTSMFWNWNGGYKFLRMDGAARGIPGWRLHLGSTNCEADVDGNITGCGQPNRPSVTLDSFDWAQDTIVLDVADLLVKANLDADVAGPPGCMSAPTDVECEQYFEPLGIPWAGGTIPAQTAFSVQ